MSSAVSIRTTNGGFCDIRPSHENSAAPPGHAVGGVVGDLAGFCAATYLRGVRAVQVPTTLLAQADSCIGSKSSVNMGEYKNLVGSFHPPALVVCDPSTLTTLPRREFRAGLYEVVKYGVIRSPVLLDRLEHNLPAIFARCVIPRM